MYVCVCMCVRCTRMCADGVCVCMYVHDVCMYVTYGEHISGRTHHSFVHTCLHTHAHTHTHAERQAQVDRKDRNRRATLRKDAIRLGYRVPVTGDKKTPVDASKMDIVNIYLEHVKLEQLSSAVILSTTHGMATLPEQGINLILHIIQSSFQTGDIMELMWSLYSVRRRSFIT